MLLPWVLLNLLLLPKGGAAQNDQRAMGCEQPDEINDGKILLSNNLDVGSTLTITCNLGYYPYPVASRMCQEDGKWTRMTTRTGRMVSKASCKEIRCAKPAEFEHGFFSPPRNFYPINSSLNFECIDGYTLRGSAERTCMPNGKWNGTTAICDNGAGHCPNPGIPIGATKTGSRYQIDAKVRYQCSRGMDLVGSDERVCQESHEWTGTEPSCQFPYSFDLPEDVQAQFGASISNILDLENPFRTKTENAGRTITIEKNGILNIYILVDASKSVDEESFDTFKECVTFLIEGITKFDIDAHFGILSYATEPKVVVAVYDEDSGKAAELLEHVEKKMMYKAHKDKSGTNIRAALEQVYGMMVFQATALKKEVWRSIRHAVLLLTDGKSNTGGSPKEVIRKIHTFLEIESNRTDYLDIYAFGTKTLDVDKAELNDIASKKRGENHVFVLDSANDLKTAFDTMLDFKNIGEMCGLSTEKPDAELQLKAPWNVVIQVISPICRGSLVAKNWVLTAAHCFHKGVDLNIAKVLVGSRSQGASKEIEMKSIRIAEYIQHPCYDVKKLQAEGIKEHYDYDVALLRLEIPVTFLDVARPICIPCTESTNRALKMPTLKNCKDQKDELLRVSELEAEFVTIQDEILKTKLMVKEKRDACTQGIKTWDGFKNITDVSKLMRPRYLCTEGDNGSSTCKGESGGALYVTRRHRYYELGVLSWGVFNACNNTKNRRDPPPRGLVPRDFHISLFEVQPWLRKHLGKDLTFLPDEEAMSECPK